MKTNLEDEIFSMHNLERKILVHILESNSVEDLVKNTNLSEKEVIMGLQMLNSRGLIDFNYEEETYVWLDNFGLKFLEKGLPEYIVLKKLGQEKKRISELELDREILNAALGELKKNNLIRIEKDTNGELILIPTKEASDYLSKYSNPLEEFKKPVREENLTQIQKEILDKFKFRKGFLKKEKKKIAKFSLNEKGKIFAEEIKNNYSNLDLIEAITPEMLKKKSWVNKFFRHYDLNVETSMPQVGRRHPMFEANDILREIFIEMGFSEMRGPIIESAFWCMDVMWIPQDHPARDEQDTFYLEDKAKLPDRELVDKVREMHEIGIKKTHTQKGDFSEEIASKRLLRTHSTATSFRLLYELGKKLKNKKDINGKYFYIAPVFRNEAIDATHLAEFFQGEGFIIGDNLSLADLMGFVKEYYEKLGIKKIRFKPTFNPYTEPSMEAHYYDEKLNKWYALINSGIFRPETLKPLGLENKRIIAWGMGASRVATLLTGKSSLREITGTTCDIDWLSQRPKLERKIFK